MYLQHPTFWVCPSVFRRLQRQGLDCAQDCPKMKKITTQLMYTISQWCLHTPCSAISLQAFLGCSRNFRGSFFSYLTSDNFTRPQSCWYNYTVATARIILKLNNNPLRLAYSKDLVLRIAGKVLSLVFELLLKSLQKSTTVALSLLNKTCKKLVIIRQKQGMQMHFNGSMIAR